MSMNRGRRRTAFAAWSATLVLLATHSEGHAKLTSPAARIMADTENGGPGVKLQPYGDARSVADVGCGGAANGDPGINRAAMENAAIVYTPGTLADVSWELTIPHPEDNRQTGVRIAIHYGPGDSFAENVLFGCIEGEEQCDPNDPNNDNKIKDANPRPGTSQFVSVQLPEGKTCPYCTIQFLWTAKNDGGFYMGCQDISITEDGILPDFNNIPDQTGKELSTLQVDSQGNVTDLAAEGGNTVAVAIGVVVGILALLCVGFFVYRRMSGGGGGGITFKGSTPPPPGSDTGSAGLPSGWSAAVDPASGRTYYVNATTGQTSWEPPAVATSATSTPPQGGPPKTNLPAGWSSAVDPNSGQTYYMNNITGQTSWEPPVGRV